MRKSASIPLATCPTFDALVFDTEITVWEPGPGSGGFHRGAQLRGAVRRAAIVATGMSGKDGGYDGDYQFWAAIAPIGKVGPIAMPRHNISRLTDFSTKTPISITSCRPMP